MHLIYCIALLKNLVNLTEQRLQGNPVFVRLLAHTGSFRKNRTSLQMFLWVLRNFSRQLFNIQDLWMTASENVWLSNCITDFKTKKTNISQELLASFSKMEFLAWSYSLIKAITTGKTKVLSGILLITTHSAIWERIRGMTSKFWNSIEFLSKAVDLQPQF